jgi:uncharacterized protein YjiS (DUF1127 family)
MKNIHSIDTDSFALTGASASPANTTVPAADFPSDLHVMRMVASSRAARNVYVATKIGQMVKSVASRIALWNRTRTTRQALASLDNHLLADIGMERGEINEYLGVSKPSMLARAISAAVKTVIQWISAHNTRATMLRLSDAQLNDIGMTRFDVEVMVRDIRGGRLAMPAPVVKPAPIAKKTVKLSPAVNNNVSSWFISPRRAA